MHYFRRAAFIHSFIHSTVAVRVKPECALITPCLVFCTIQGAVTHNKCCGEQEGGEQMQTLLLLRCIQGRKDEGWCD